MNLKPGWSETDGELWYARPGGGGRVRARGVWRTCQNVRCGARFPSLPGNPGKYCSFSCIHSANGGHHRRGTRDDLFTRWDVDECWLAGILWTDGSLCDANDGRGTRKVKIAMTDQAVIQEAARITGCTPHSYEQKPPRQTVHEIRFAARDVVGRLAEAGMDQPKLTTRSWPALPHPAAFLRGLMDGDGYVTWHYQGKRTATSKLRLFACLCGSMPLLTGAQGYLKEFGIKPKNPYPAGASKRIYSVGWNHADCLRLAKILYSDDGPCMARKRAAFLNDPN